MTASQISVVIPALNAGAHLPRCLEALVGAAIDGLVREVIVVDGGSADDTAKIADAFGARIVETPPGRGGQLAAGARVARGEWLLFLHADTVLAHSWAPEAERFMATQEGAAVFTLRFDAKGLAPRIVESGAMARTRLLKAPYGDQGLLIRRALYDEAGGYGDLPLMEDVAFVRSLAKLKGRGVVHVLRAEALTSAARYERDGYARRVVKNAVLLARYFLGASPHDLARDYR